MISYPGKSAIKYKFVLLKEKQEIDGSLVLFNNHFIGTEFKEIKALGDSLTGDRIPLQTQTLE